MDFESRIHDMLEEIDGIKPHTPVGPEYCQQYHRNKSKYSIIEKYFKKIREDARDNTIGQCLDVVENSGAYDGVKRIIIYRIKKL